MIDSTPVGRIAAALEGAGYQRIVDGLRVGELKFQFPAAFVRAKSSADLILVADLASESEMQLTRKVDGVARALDIAQYLVLPTLTLALGFLAIYLRIMRASMLEVLTLDFVRTARAKGLAEHGVIVRHVLRNALLPMVTLMGLQVGTMLGGSVVVESVFALPGLGRLAYESVVQRDLNMLLGIVFVSAVLVIVVNFIVDIAYARLDPRIGSGR